MYRFGIKRMLTYVFYRFIKLLPCNTINHVDRKKKMMKICSVYIELYFDLYFIFSRSR